MHNKVGSLKERDAVVILMIISLIVLGLPFFIRFLSFDSILMGDYPYYHSRLASDVLDGDISAGDDMVLGGRDYTINPYHFVLAFFGMFITVDLASKLIPLFAGISSIVLFFLLLKRFNISLEIRFVTALLVILTPAFIYGFVISNPHCISLLLILVASHLYLRGTTVNYLLSVLLFIAASLFGITPLVIILLITACYAVYKTDELKKLLAVNLAVIMISLLVNLFVVHLYSIPQVPFVDVTQLITETVSDLGGQISFGIFNLILAVIGVFTWGFRERPKFTYLIALLLFLLFAFVNKIANLYLAFFLSFFAAVGFLALYDMRWHIKLIRDISLFIIVCGLLFSTISFTNRLVDLHPYPEEYQGLLWLKYHTPEDSIVLSAPQQGFWIEGVAERRVLFDPSSVSSPDSTMIMADMDRVLSSRNLGETKSLLDKYGIDYIYLTKDMQEDVWGSQEKGLVFLFRSNETFKKEYASSDVQVWRYNK